MPEDDAATASATAAEPRSSTRVGGLNVRLARRGRTRDPADLPVVVLHGWGAHLEAIEPIVAPLAAETEVLALDLPGFGESEEPPRPWSSEDYARFVATVLEDEGISRCHLIGHSRGGAIAICLAVQRPDLVGRLILCDAAGLRPKRGLRYRWRVALAKLGRLLGLLGPPGRRLQARIRGRVASSDYLNASPAMRETLRRVIAEDLAGHLPRISAPALLVWGSADEDTPLWMGERMAELLPDGALVVFEGAGHFAYADQPGRFAQLSRHFLCEQPREVRARERGSVSAGEWIALALGAFAAWVLLAARAHLFLHLLQQEHYELKRLRIWVRRRGERVSGLDVLLAAITGCLLAVAFGLGSTAAALAIGALGLVAAAVRARTVFRRPQVKPLVFTSRARRLFALALALFALALAAAPIAAGLASAVVGALALAAVAVLLVVLAPELLGAANLILRPVQRADNARFERRARRKLREVAPTVIGITGSYGKTTTKGCVAQVANLVGPALPTPASFNSYLGVIRTINENLRPNHRTFVVEMGAYRRGDIAELCRLVEPRIGVLTAIGPAHLERFGSLRETTLAKGELGEALPADGVFVTRADDERCREAAERVRCPVRLFAPEPHPEACAWAEGLRLHNGRTHFELCLGTGASAARHPVSARLLGKHNVANLLAAAAVGVELGLAPEQIARALGQVSPPEHRLAPIVNRAAGIVVIDDAYNANPSGAQSALEVLATHPGSRRVLVTPGMVELGDQEEIENERFGAAAAAVCDVVVLVGEEQTVPIRRGLEGAGFPAGSLRIVANSSGAQEFLAESSRAGDVILFENDLPDLYQRRSGDAGESTASAA